jgi:hypothetical protein
MTTTRRNLSLLALIGLVALLLLSRLAWLGSIQLDVDEVWSVWQTMGSPADIIRWTPYDWTPTYYLLLGAWRGLVGIQPEFLRLFTLLAFMISAACLVRAGWRLDKSGRAFGWLAALVFIALGYNIFNSVYVRGVAFALVLLPPTLWLMLRYFDKPTTARGILLGMFMALMFWVYLNSPLALAMLGVFSLCLYPRKWWRWWLPALIFAILSAPVVISKLDIAINRTTTTGQQILPPLVEAIIGLYRDYFGAWAGAWLVMFIIASLLIALRFTPLATWLYQPRPENSARLTLGLLLWVAAALIVLYALNPILGFFNNHYTWWIVPGVALWIAWGLAALPRNGQVVSAAILIVLAFAPVNIGSYTITSVPTADNLRWLASRYQPGDAMLIDPNCRCPEPEVFDYYRSVYFPNGLLTVDSLENERRIWYAATDGEQTADLAGAIQAGRRAGEFVGPWEYLIRLYEAPPDPDGIGFDNGMRFHGMDVFARDSDQYETGVIARREGDPLGVQMWWSADSPLARDYSVGLFLLAPDGTVIAQMDAPPQVSDGSQATSQWEDGRFYVERRTLDIPMGTPTSDYQLLMAVYYYADNTRFPAPGFTNADDLLPLGTVSVRSW